MTSEGVGFLVPDGEFEGKYFQPDGVAGVLAALLSVHSARCSLTTERTTSEKLGEYIMQETDIMSPMVTTKSPPYAMLRI